MDKLALLLQAASAGGRKELADFLTAFRDSRLIIPERHQSPAFKPAARYPERLLNILGIEDAGITYVPVFSQAELSQQWAGKSLKIREMLLSDLIRILPEDWWLASNPGSEMRKDFSPWELQRLLGGEQEINEIITEIEADYGASVLRIRPLFENEIPGLANRLRELFETDQNIIAVYLAIEEAETSEGSGINTLLTGLKLSAIEPNQLSTFREKVLSYLSPLLIGSYSLKVLVGVGFSDLELGVFSDCAAIMQR